MRDDLVTSLEDLLLSDREIDYVILEASGVADPEGVVMTFLEARYERLLRLDSITCVVDAEGLFDDSDDADLAMLKLRQIGFADLVVLNKVDLVGPDNVSLIKEWIGSHLNRVRIVESNFCDVPLEILLSVGRFDPAQLGAVADGEGHEEPHFDTWHYQTKDPLDERRLRETIRTLPASVYRCKGFVHLTEAPADRYVIQAVGRRSALQPLDSWGAATPTTDIVVIGAEGAMNTQVLQAAFDACIAESS